MISSKARLLERGMPIDVSIVLSLQGRLHTVWVVIKPGMGNLEIENQKTGNEEMGNKI